MSDTLPYFVYFFGPFLLAFIIGKKFLKEKYSTFAIGLLAFFLAWVCSLVVTQIFAATGTLPKEGTILYSLIVSASAGLFEESTRFFAFRVFKSLREKRNWNTGIMYAIGHSGMESIIVGGSLILTIVVVKFAPQLLSPEVLNQCEAALDINLLHGLYNSFERLFVGLLIHACFTCVVLLSLVKSQKKYLLFAMLWHFGHNMVGLNLHRISQHWIAGKIWIIFIIIVYSWILFRLRRIITNENA